MNNSKYGFTYIWFDRKHKRYYIGCHWGTVDDGYVCSSNWMYKTYTRRKEDFKRRILKTNISREQMYVEEQKLFDMIKDTEIKPKNPNPRYYNLCLSSNNLWHKYPDKVKLIGEKISHTKKGKSTGPCSPEKAKAISDAKKAKFIERELLTGSKVSEETRLKLAQNATGKTHTEEWKENQSNRLKDEWASGLRTSNGPLSDEHREKISKANTGKKLSSDQVQFLKENNSKKYIITKTDGTILEINGLKNFAHTNNIPYTSLHVYYKKGIPLRKYNIESITSG